MSRVRKVGAGGRAGGILSRALLIALLAGCGQDMKPLAPVAETPAGDLPPQVEAVFPAARSSGVLYDTAIWVRFLEPLDPASVTDHTVFFKLDTVRFPVALAYDAPSRTIHVTPLVTLHLLRTYTIEITSGVRTADGRPLSPGFWQFKTNGLRRLVDPTPKDRASDESPFAFLDWGETEPSAGSIVYRVYEGADSAAIAARSPSPIYVGAEPHLVPKQRWPLGARLYWAVTAVNQTSVEQMDSPVWSFATLSPGLPVDSLIVLPTEWGYFDRTLNTKTCRGEFIYAGSRYNGGIHWPLQETASNLKLARARIVMWGTSANPISGAPGIYSVQQPWATCEYTTMVPMVESTRLASAVRITLTPNIAFESDTLTACLEAAARSGPVYGFGLRASLGVFFLGPVYGLDGPRLTLYYYRTPAPAPIP
jgi:Big-like domain-containing protein